jgi:SH3 domain.
MKRASLNQSTTPKPVPGGGKPRPPLKPKPALPKCQALYGYTAKDIDELSFQEGDIIEVVKERTYFYILFWGHMLGSYCIHNRDILLFALYDCLDFLYTSLLLY